MELNRHSLTSMPAPMCNACVTLWLSLEKNDLLISKSELEFSDVATRTVPTYMVRANSPWSRKPLRCSAPLQQSKQFNITNQKQTARTD